MPTYPTHSSALRAPNEARNQRDQTVLSLTYPGNADRPRLFTRLPLPRLHPPSPRIPPHIAPRALLHCSSSHVAEVAANTRTISSADVRAVIAARRAAWPFPRPVSAPRLYTTMGLHRCTPLL
eukprot:5934589-Prymnesium_polylepis.1